MENQTTFTDEMKAQIEASKASENGSFQAVIETGGNFLIYAERNPHIYEDETLIAVFKDGEQLDWSEVYD